MKSYCPAPVAGLFFTIRLASGYTGIDVDEASGVMRGYHRTEVDYNTEVYYTPGVCGSLSKDDVEQTRGCTDGLITATINAQTPYVAGSTYSALSDHYVRMEYEEEDPYNPGYSYFQDVLGYSFTTVDGYPDFWNFLPSGIYYQRPDQSIRLGNTYVVVPAVTFANASIPGSQGPFASPAGVQAAHLTASQSQCDPYSSFVLTVTYSLPSHTSEVTSVTAQGFGNTSVREWNVQDVNDSVNFSFSPPTGRAWMTVNNKNGGRTNGPPYDAIRVTVNGRYNSAETFSTPADVHIQCP